jgi:hypothetical protein
MSVNPGEFLYVPQEEAQIAISFGAVYIEGDARLRVPTPLPEGVDLKMFERWTSQEYRVIWLSEFLENICGGPVDLLNVAGLIESISEEKLSLGSSSVPLYVPKFEMDRVRIIPGVIWDRKIRRYVAERTADFTLIFPYLTPAMRAAWIADHNLETEIDTLMKARALKYQIEGVDGGDRIEMERLPEERKPGKQIKKGEEEGW